MSDILEIVFHAHTLHKYMPTSLLPKSVVVDMAATNVMEDVHFTDLSHVAGHPLDTELS